MFSDSGQRPLTHQAHCRVQLARALQQLGAAPKLTDLEQCAQVIWSTLGSHTRVFHNFGHILQLIEEGDAIQTLAALFHDVVYIQVDGGLTAPVYDLLRPYLALRDGQLYLKGISSLRQQRAGALVASLFGFKAATPQLASCHNELLSALLATVCLEPLLDWGDIAQVIVAIEATIPFRPQPSPENQSSQVSPAEWLFLRLQQANITFNLGLDSAGLLRAIHRAVSFANRDVESFATADPAIFLNHTWRLLPELNPALREPMRYSVRDYRQALQRMEHFFQGLRADSIFQQFHQIPDRPTCQSWQRRAQQNLAVAQLYLQTKLVAIALLEALAPYYQGDCAMADWISTATQFPAWEDSFGRWSLSHPLSTRIQSQVLQVAEQGRHGECQFDLPKSPLAAFLIRAIGFERIHQLRIQADALFEDRLSPEDFLGQCEAKVVQAVTRRLQQPA